MAKVTIEDMQKIATSRGGKCLSQTYITTNQKLTWQCAQEHQWDATPNSVKRGTWCPACHRQNRTQVTIDDMHQLAAAHNGKCLSTTYINTSEPLIWQCEHDHQMSLPPKAVKTGSWCPQCSRQNNKPKYTIEDMQRIAASHDGKCLSTGYKNVTTPLQWECKNGHKWTTKPFYIIHGSWCSDCRKRRLVMTIK